MEMQKVDMAIDSSARRQLWICPTTARPTLSASSSSSMSPAMIGTVPMYDAIGYLEKDLLEIIR